MQHSIVRRPRLLYLDSARGLAALSVMMWHFLVAFVPRDSADLLKNPVHLLYYGEADIIFFFIHSGFILSYSYAHKLSAAISSYLGFLIERTFRIYPLF
jgi:peptidoglycan/LPS O-acetylase OafA/YrhL